MQKNELPWSPPRKGIFDGLKDILNGAVMLSLNRLMSNYCVERTCSLIALVRQLMQDSTGIVPTTIGAAAAAGIGAAFFTEVATSLSLFSC